MAHNNIEYSLVNVDDNIINNNDDHDNGNNGRPGLDARRRTNNNNNNNTNGLRDSNTSLVSKNSDARKPRRFVSNCAFSLIILGISLTFLLGVLVGFYVRESQRDILDFDDICEEQDTEVNYDTLGARHEAVVNYIRGINIKDFVDSFGAEDPVTGSRLEQRLEKEIVNLFNLYGLDSVKVEEHDIVVTSPDPTQPNHLQILHANGSLQQSFNLVNANSQQHNVTNSTTNSESHENDGTRDAAFWTHPHVVFSPSGDVTSSLVYGHYGLESDFKLLTSIGEDVKGKIVLLRLGRMSVAEKILISERFGASAVLLYQDPSHVDKSQMLPHAPDYIPTVSAMIYSSEMTGLWKPSIPCQTISANQAAALMKKLFKSHSGNDNRDDDEENESGEGDSTLRDFYNRNTENVIVDLKVFNKARNQKIKNIIGTIQGFSETDHYVIIGTPRSSLPGEFQDVIASTSILTQIAHGFHFVHQLHKWKPRRGVKFISWGGAEFSNAGALMYIKNRHHLLDRRAIAYFDLRLLVTGKDFVTTQTSGSLHQLLKETAFEVPDPKDPEATLQSSWMDTREEKPNNVFMPVISYDEDTTQTPFLHILGIPTIRAQFCGVSNESSSIAMKEEEYKHHFKFHMAIVRVASKAVLSILDNEIIPLNMKYFAEDVSTTVWQTSGLIEQCSNDQENMEVAVSASDVFIKTADAFEELSKIFLRKKDKQGVEMCNNIKMMMEKLFIVQRNSLSHHILHPTQPDGSLLLADELCQYATSTKDWSLLRQMETAMSSIINEATLGLKMAA